MKKVTIICITIILLLIVFANVQSVFGESKVIDQKTEGTLIEIKENAANSIEDYKVKYGSDAYGVTAYILHVIQIYSIPFCFLGIALSAIHRYVIGIRKLDVLESGMVSMVSFISILIICQILPLAFAIFVKFGRG